MVSILGVPNLSTFFHTRKQRSAVEWRKLSGAEFPISNLIKDATQLVDSKMTLDRREVLFSTVGILTGALLQDGEGVIAVAAGFTDRILHAPYLECLMRTGFHMAVIAGIFRQTMENWHIMGAASPMPALRGKDYGKTKMHYADYSETESGLQYKDLREGTGPSPKSGEVVVVDWDGYTIGYLGRIFEARNKAKGGPFEGGDKEFFKFKLGSQQVIPAFEEAVAGMSLGGIRRIVVPPELGYPDYDYNKKGPRPTTFSGQRHLDFVLRNQGLIDKTLLFDIELLKIVPS